MTFGKQSIEINTENPIQAQKEIEEDAKEKAKQTTSVLVRAIISLAEIFMK